MNTKNDVEVVIGGKQYTLSGYESSEYLQKIATHINDKLSKFREQDGYARLDADVKNVLLAINLADDYYKAQKSADNLQKANEDLEKEIFDLKHDLIAMKNQLEEREQQLETLEKEKTHSEHKAIRLEAELDGRKAEEAEVADHNGLVVIRDSKSKKKGKR
ncbi:MAG: cell division protein ZapA [Lachnospiraceae bacterium]|nr:cell division protein ZapA [Lachnospiraceae bacterium]